MPTIISGFGAISPLRRNSPCYNALTLLLIATIVTSQVIDRYHREVVAT